MNRKELKLIFEDSIEEYPFPIAFRLNKYFITENLSESEEWEFLCGDLFINTIKFLSHILLSELAASETKIGRLFFHIESILSRPMGGNYVGFLREASLALKKHQVKSALSELVDLMYKSETQCTILPENKALLNELLLYRNLLAHGEIPKEVAEREIGKIRQLIGVLIDKLSFLKNYQLMFPVSYPLVLINFYLNFQAILL